MMPTSDAELEDMSKGGSAWERIERNREFLKLLYAESGGIKRPDIAPEIIAAAAQRRVKRIP